MLKISSSSATTARTCWKKFYFRYEEHLRPITTTINLLQGRVIHEAFDKFYKGGNHQAITKYIMDTFDLELSKAEYVDQEVLEIAKYTTLGAWLGYPHHKRTQYSVTSSEIDFNVPVKRGVQLWGKIDRTLKSANQKWIGELKFTGESEQQFKKRMEVSYQATSYIYAMQKMGHNIRGVVFDCLRKPLLRKGRVETCSQYCRRIAYDYKRRSEFYYYTYTVYRSPLQIKMFHKDMCDLATDILRKQKTKQYYRNPDSCWNYNTECPYKKICFEESIDPLLKSLYYTVGGEKGGINGRKEEEGGSQGTSS